MTAAAVAPAVVAEALTRVPAHAPAHSTGATWFPVPLLSLAVLGLVAVGYLVLAARASHRRGWSPWRAASFTAGAALLGSALSPRFDALADADFGVHMAQHLLVAMVAPLALVLGAPVTLLLRALPSARARLLGRVLRTGPMHLLAHPITALLLSSGGLAALYLTPLYAATTTSEPLHALVHVHLVASGYLFAWAIAGPDPSPGRATVRTRLVVLGVAVAVHAVVAQLLYAGLLVQVHEPVAEMQAAGNLMYFGGDVAELLLAVALLLAWKPRRGRSPGSRRNPARGQAPAPSLTA
jgi:putative membrane protein